MVAITSFVLAASSIIGLAQATPNMPIEARQTAYKNYRGDGTAAMGWPTESQWASFDTIWATAMTGSRHAGACKWHGVAGNSAAEQEILKAGIKRAATESGLDARFILAVVLQESMGCVRMPTTISTNLKLRNPGLFQSDGKISCNDPEVGIPLMNPCPSEQINGMINDGMGTTPGVTWGFTQLIKRSGATDVSRYYKAGVYYNSGVMPADGNLGKGRSNACYASDLANRMMGWIADKSPCNRDTIGNL